MPVMLHRFTGVDAVGQQWGFAWHSLTAASVDASQANAVTWAENLWNGVGGAAGLHGSYPTSTVLDNITTYLLSVTPPYKSTSARTQPVTLAGTSGSSPLPAQTSVLVSLRTPFTGRAFRGRFYLPAVGVTALTTLGEFDPTAQSAFRDSLTQAWAVSNPAGEQPVIFSKTTGLAQVITSFLIGDKFDTQRRRVQSIIPTRIGNAMP